MIFLVGLLWLPVGAVIYAWTLSVLWRWFLLPLGLPDLTLPHLFGVALVVSYMTVSTPARKKDQDPAETVTYAIAMSLTRAGVALAAGWVALQLMGGAA
jgi:hypothetical protein